MPTATSSRAIIDLFRTLFVGEVGSPSRNLRAKTTAVETSSKAVKGSSLVIPGSRCLGIEILRALEFFVIGGLSRRFELSAVNELIERLEHQ